MSFQRSTSPVLGEDTVPTTPVYEIPQTPESSLDSDQEDVETSTPTTAVKRSLALEPSAPVKKVRFTPNYEKMKFGECANGCVNYFPDYSQYVECCDNCNRQFCKNCSNYSPEHYSEEHGCMKKLCDGCRNEPSETEFCSSCEEPILKNDAKFYFWCPDHKNMMCINCTSGCKGKATICKRHGTRSFDVSSHVIVEDDGKNIQITECCEDRVKFICISAAIREVCVLEDLEDGFEHYEH